MNSYGWARLPRKSPSPLSSPTRGGGERRTNLLKDRNREGNLDILLPWWEEVRRRGIFIVRG